MNWALRVSIKQNALNELLKLPSKQHSLPRDSPKLLRTSNLNEILPMNDMSGNAGDYVYFRLQHEVKKS
jgi:hypothetical protein